MKLNKFFIVALAALTFAACSKDGADNGVPVEGVRTNATLVITQPNTIKIPPTQATEDGILNEGKITDVTVLLFTSGGVLETKATPTTTPTATGVVTAKFEVLSGINKKVFVIANAGAATLDLTGLVAGTTTLAQFKKVISKIDATALVTSTSDFVMTNLSDPGMVTLDPAVTTPVAGGSNFIEAKIGRIVGKIRPNLTSATANSGAMGSLTTIAFKTINVAEYTYIWAEKEVAAPFRAITPYLELKKGTALSTAGATNGVAYEDYLFEGAYEPVLPSGTAVNALNVSYALENSNVDAKRGNTTRLVIKGVFTPLATKFYDGALIDADPALTGVADLGSGHQTVAAPVLGATFYAVAKKIVANTKVVGYEIKAMVNTATISNTAIFVAAEDVMLTYTNGESFYGVWVSGESTSDYTITRNGLYSVNINGVAGPGVDSENKVISEPEVNIELKTNIVIDVKLLPWEVYEQEVILQ